ncbi:unnamed protein product [Heligmosomoides polygyrus]|uniref:DM10 domain-containing protein n=1 Tax=Heligmosomoides polygyrus TaxID=6339 RepID=A0A183GNL3_HELPZ|nr:unnamed protein product [Heligmosomoides polygyrus]
MIGTSTRALEPPTMHREEQVWDGVLLELDEEEISNDMVRMVIADVDTDARLSSYMSPPRCSHLADSYARSSAVPGREREEATLVDLGTSVANGSGRYSPDESSIALLEYPTIGFQFDLNDPDLGASKTMIEPGTLLKPLSELDDPRVIAFLKHQHGESRRKDALLARDLLTPSVYAVVPKTNVMRLTNVFAGHSAHNTEQSQKRMMLLAIDDCEQRVLLYRDFETFDFLRGLRMGDAVFVKESGKMYSGRVNRIGERPYRYGTWYNIEIPV